MKKITKFIKENSTDIVISIIGFIAFIIGTLTIGFPLALLAIGILLAVYFALPVEKQNKIIKRKNTPVKKETSKGKNFIKKLLIVCFTGGIFVLIAGIIFLGYVVISAPDFDPEKLYNKEASILYHSDGTIMRKLGAELREKITYDQLPEVLVDAIIATEDARYFQHSGVDLPRFLNASVKQALGMGGGGASTITMQVSKNQFTSDESEGIQGIVRKFTDIYLSVFKIEKNYTKQEILEFYVNTYYLGDGNYGVEQASLGYFGKSAKELSLAEAAMIAGLFQAPGKYDPYINPDKCEARRQTVLSLMLRHGYISDDEYKVAKELTVDKILAKKNNEKAYQAYVDTVIEEVIKRTGKDPNFVPMEIYTNMDKNLQEHMDGVMNGEKYDWVNNVIQSGSIILNVKTGQIAAVGAGRNRVGERTQNYATMLKRQIGSTAKALYEYAPGIEYNNWSTYTPFVDIPTNYTGADPIYNWDSKYVGMLTLHQSLRMSRNTTALRAFKQVKNSDIVTFVKGLNLSPEIENGRIHEAHAVGAYNGESPLTMAAAYAAFSNGGFYIEPHSFSKIVYRETGETYEVKPKKQRVMSEETAYMMTKVLEDTTSYAMGGNVNGVNYAAKTGTTNFDRNTLNTFKLPSSAINDRWVLSFNDTYAISIWYGYDYLTQEMVNNKHYLTTASYSHRYLFNAIAKGVYTKKSEWKQPEGVVKVEVESGLSEAKLPSEFTPRSLIVSEYFKKGTEPTEVSDRYSQLENIKNLDYKKDTNTLTWDAVKTPNAIDQTWLDNYFTQLYDNQSYKEKYLNDRLYYNNTTIGTIVYEVYTKEANGDLKLLGTTKETSFKHQGTGTTTYVVKTAYTIFKDNRSLGAELTVTNQPIVNVYSVSFFKDQSVVNVKQNEKYAEPATPIIVLENLTSDVTSKAKITYTIKKNSETTTFTDFSLITTDKVGDVYTVSYTVTINNYTETVNKIINIVS